MTKPAKSHGYIDHVGDEEHFWHIETLWEAAKALSVKEVALDDLPWFEDDCAFLGCPPTWGVLAQQCKQAMNVDLSYPIILNINGDVMDGMHRIIKTFVAGKTTIQAVQFEQIPKPDRIKPLTE